MATQSVCQACHRALRIQRHPQASLAKTHPRVVPSSTIRRPLSTRSQHLKAAAPPKPYQSKPKATTTAASTSSSASPSTASSSSKPNSPETTTTSETSLPNAAQYIPIPETARSLAKGLRDALPRTTETYVAYGACEKLMKECARQAEYTVPQMREKKGTEVPKTEKGEELGIGNGWWYDVLKLPPTFNTWAQVTFLHMYFLTVRFRCFPADHVTPWHQHLIDHFSNLAEDKMILDHNVDMRALRSRYLKDLFDQWRGIQAGYDEGLVRGDAVLATAVWRNIFRADPNVDFRGVGEVVSYIRHVLSILQDLSDGDVASGELGFDSNPGSERSVVLVKSKLMDAPAANVEPRVKGEAGL